MCTCVAPERRFLEKGQVVQPFEGRLNFERQPRLICCSFSYTLQASILDEKQVVEAFDGQVPLVLAANNPNSYPGSTVTPGVVGVARPFVSAGLSINTTNKTQLLWRIAECDALNCARGYEVTPLR
jgi:hypothetical protein